MENTLEINYHNLVDIKTSVFEGSRLEQTASKKGGVRASTTGKIRSKGMMELANVKIASKMIDQISSVVSFKSNSNVIKATDKMTGYLLDIKI